MVLPTQDYAVATNREVLQVRTSGKGLAGPELPKMAPGDWVLDKVGWGEDELVLRLFSPVHTRGCSPARVSYAGVGQLVA